MVRIEAEIALLSGEKTEQGRTKFQDGLLARLGPDSQEGYSRRNRRLPSEVLYRQK